MLLPQLAETGHKLLPASRSILQHPLVPNGTDRRHCRGTSHRVASIGPAVASRIPFLHQIHPGHDRSQGQAGGEPLGQNDNIRLYLEVLEGEPPPGPAEAGLDLVQNQQHAMRVADLAQALQEAVGWHDIATLP